MRKINSNMRNTILSILILISSTAFAQLTILNGAQLTVTNDGYLYANEAIVNQGTVTLIQVN